MRPVGGLCSIARPACERPDSCGSTYVSLLLQANIRKGYPMNVNGLTLRRRWWDEEEVGRGGGGGVLLRASSKSCRRVVTGASSSWGCSAVGFSALPRTYMVSQQSWLFPNILLTRLFTLQGFPQVTKKNKFY